MNGSSLAASSKFRTFAIVFSIAAVVLYVSYVMTGWTLFSFHPATGRLEWGRTNPRPNEGPVMYWYGWVLAMLLAAGVLGLLATLIVAALVLGRAGSWWRREPAQVLAPAGA